jgi:Tetracyclin repressor-like, C-terminal domain
MSFVSRGFRVVVGRVDSARVPPGQYVTDDYPVLSAGPTPHTPLDDPYADLVAELTAFRTGVTRPDGLSLVGTMLQRGTEPELLRLYRERLVIPRRTRLRTILERALTRGLLPGGDLDLAVASLTGSFYALALAGSIPTRWPTRAAAHAWRSLGGTPPTDHATAERGQAA